MATYPYPFQMMHNGEPEETTDGKKLSVKDHVQAWAGAIGIVGGLFAFALILGIIFMDYDPMTMFKNIMQDLKAIFGGIK